MQLLYLLREQHGGILALAARAITGGENEYLVHADVKSASAKGIDQLIDEREHHAIHIRVQRTPTSAVDSLVVRVFSRCFVELRMPGQQRECVLRPGLMAQAIEAGDQPDSVAAAE